MSFYIYDLLPTGENNAISRRELMSITGYTDRQLRRQIAAERRAGALILSSVDGTRGGYFKPTEGNSSEIKRYIASMASHAKNTLITAMKAYEALEELEEQEEREQYAETIV